MSVTRTSLKDCLLCKHFHLNGPSVGGLLFSCISVLPVFKLFPEMNVRGQVVTTTFFTSAIAVFAAHLGYIAGTSPEVILPMVVAKLSSGLLGILLALYFTSPE